MWQNVLYEEVTFSSLDLLEHRTFYFLLPLLMGLVGITLSLATHMWLHLFFFSYTCREGVLLSEKRGISSAGLSTHLSLKNRGRSRAGTMQQCEGLFVHRDRTRIALTVRSAARSSHSFGTICL